MPYTREPLSGGAHGVPIKVVATATAGTLIHTAQASPTLVDVITLFACNHHATETIRLTLEKGGVASPDNLLVFDIPPKTTVPVLLDGVLRNSLVLRAFASIANMIVIDGFVNVET